MGWRWLTFWRRQKGPLADMHIIVYTRRGCHLCERGLSHLESRRGRYGFSLEMVDVDSNPALVRLHGEQVPVVVIDGKVRFCGCVNPVLLDRLLEARSAIKTP